MTLNFDDQGQLNTAGTAAQSELLDCNRTEDATVAAAVRDYQVELGVLYGSVVGYLNTTADGRQAFAGDCVSIPSCDGSVCQPGSAVTFVGRCGCRVKECGAGSLIADAMRSVAGADVGIINAGAMADSIAAGPVTTANLLPVLPYLNQVVTIRLSGSALRAALEFSIQALCLVRSLSEGERPFSASERFAQDSVVLDPITAMCTLGLVTLQRPGDASHVPFKMATW